MITCPMCDAVLDVEEDELDEGDELTCEECGQTILVKSTDPLELKGESDAEEDDDEEFDYDEDEEDEDDDEDEEDGEDEEEEEDW